MKCFEILNENEYFVSEHMLNFFQTFPRQAHLKGIILGASILSKKIFRIFVKAIIKHFENIRGQIYKTNRNK
jgi:hypothetical protein